MPVGQRSPSGAQESRLRVVIFTSRESGVAAVLIRAAAAALAARPDLELAAFCLTESKPYLRALRRHALERAARIIGSVLGPGRRRGPVPPLPISIQRLARRHRAEMLVPPEGDINHPDFIARLRSQIRPTIALAFYCFQRFGPDLLDVFAHAVNYHNGLLPWYRGLGATAWSRYNGETETGFTFHRMDRELDRGPILLEGTIPFGPDDRTDDLDLAKAEAAAACLPRVLSAVVDGDPGTPQGEGGRYYSRKDRLAMTRIPDPALLSGAELAKRLEAFGRLEMRIAGRWHAVTRLRPAPRSSHEGSGLPGCGLRFQTSDGATLEPVRPRRISDRRQTAFAEGER